MLLALEQTGIARMLVVGPQRLDEADGRQAFVPQVLVEVAFILQVRRGKRIAGAILPRRVVVIVRERLMMPLEQRIDRRIRRHDTVVGWVAGRAGQRIVPTTRIPLPAHVSGAQTVADGGDVGPGRIGRTAFIERRE